MSGSCGRAPAEGSVHSAISTRAGPSTITAAGRGFSG
jgi:hypothetical protein